MITFVIAVLLALLIIMERMKKIKLSNMGGAMVMMLGSSICLGLYTFEFFKSVISLISNISYIEDAYLNFFDKVFEGMSNKHAVFQILLLSAIFVPFAVGIIYIIISLIKRPIEKNADESSAQYSLRCGVRSASLAIISSAVMIICIVTFVLVSIPYWHSLKESIHSLQLFNPGVWFFAIFFTLGIGIFYFLGLFTVVNSQFILIMLIGISIVFALYLYSVVLGLASCIRSVKLGVVKPIPALIAGVCMFMMGWNIIPTIYIRRSIKKSIFNHENIDLKTGV